MIYRVRSSVRPVLSVRRYTPEEIDDLSGPESDPAYAFRVVRLCEAILDAQLPLAWAEQRRVLGFA